MLNNQKKITIKDWANDDKPREKLMQQGSESLSNSELLAILINNGNKEKSALELGKEILKQSSNDLNNLAKFNLKDFTKIKGIGPAKAITIMAAIELGRRRNITEINDTLIINSSKIAAEYLKPLIQDYTIEVCGVLYLNNNLSINKFEIISKGGLTATVVDVRIILKKAIEYDSTQFILFHNHPSGSLIPSESDKQITKTVKESGNIMNIRLNDHIIISQNGFYSFANNDLL